MVPHVVECDAEEDLSSVEHKLATAWLMLYLANMLKIRIRTWRMENTSRA